MTSHHDVAGLCERLRVNTCRYADETEEAAAKRRIATDLAAADLLESQAKALSEAEAKRDLAEHHSNHFARLYKRTDTELAAAEARLAEAISILEFYAEPFEYIKKHGLEEHAPDFYDELNTGERAQDFLRARAQQESKDA